MGSLTQVNPTVPDYHGAWVGGLLPGLRASTPPAWMPDPVRGDADIFLVLVLDGLGWRMLTEREELAPTMCSMEGGPITTVAPSTTAAALTSITTGATPAEHGVVGYRFRVGGQVMNALRWQYDGEKRGPKPTEVQAITPFGGYDTPVVSKAEFATTGFTAAHLRGGTLHGWRTPATIVTRCRNLLAEGHRMVYAYYDGIDRVSHAFGLADDFLRDEIRATDRLVAELLDVLPARGALVVTADHGQVDVGAAGQRSLDAVAPLVAAYSGEGRFRSLHARTGAAGELLAAARECFGDLAWVRSRDEVVAEGWLGHRMNRTVAGRLGDVVLAAREPVAFVDPGYLQEATLESMHGSLTDDEMLVPLLAATSD
jgi:hypothetical protein